MSSRSLGRRRAIAEVAAALKSGTLECDAGTDALVKRLTALGLGESEAFEVVMAAIDRAKENAM
jgi:hypothetical protein